MARVLGPAEIGLLREAAEAVRVDDALAAYAVRIVRATRPASRGASRPRGRRGDAHGPRWRRSNAAERSRDGPVGGRRGAKALAGAGRRSFRARPRGTSRAGSNTEPRPEPPYNCSAAPAFPRLLDGRSYVLPEDVKACAPEVLRHRIVLSYEAEAEGIGADAVIARVLSTLTLP